MNGERRLPLNGNGRMPQPPLGYSPSPMASSSRTAPPEPSRAASVTMLLVAVCLVAANMRPAITGLGPLLDQIGADTGMSVSALGVLAAVPLVSWARRCV